MNLNLLRQNLTVEEIEWLPATSGFKNYESGGEMAWVQLVAYKNARVDMERLDDVCGQEGWGNDYKRDASGILQCGIGIKCVDEWVWKWSNGVPSTYHKEKGEYSDAFKRAGYMWGIGRELYQLPPLFVELKKEEYRIKKQKNNEEKVSTNFKFAPSKWQWCVNWDHKDEFNKPTGLIWAKQKTHNGKMEYRVKNTPIYKIW